MPEPSVLPCPTCGRGPDIDRCTGGEGWYAGCYDPGRRPEDEHFIGVNADTRAAAVVAWNDAVRRAQITTV